MRKNRKIPKKMSVVATNTMRFGAIIVFFFIMVILNLLSASSCTQLMKTKGTLELELAKLEDARLRESTRWEEMKTPERIENALIRHGISMHPPRPEQTVRMKSDGTPYPGQLSVARARQRTIDTAVAYLPAAKPLNTVKRQNAARSQYRRRRSR